MDDNFGLIWFKESLKRIPRGWLRHFGTKMNQGDVGIFDRYGARLMRKGQKSMEDSGGGMADPIVLHRPTGGKFIPASKAMDAHFGWVYACIKAISDEMANIDFLLYSVDKNGEHKESNRHDVLDLLDGVNEFQTGPEFKKVMSAHLELTGNCYIYLFGVKNFDDKPKAMYLLNPGTTKVYINKTTFPYKIDHYEFIDDNRKFIFQPYEIIHLKYPDPSDPFSGLGTVQGIAEWIDNDNYAMEFNRNFFKNGARMSGVFETDMESVEQMQRLKISFEEQFAGIKNAYKSMIMPKGVKWVPTQATSKEMDFASLLDMTAQRILAGFRVSKTILGTAESDTNRSTAETADYVFAKRTIKPKMEMIVSYLNEFLIPRFGDNIYLSFNDPVPEDKEFLTKEMQATLGNAALLTQNEAREKYLGMEPIDGGDQVYVPNTLQALGTPPAKPTTSKTSKKNKFIRASKGESTPDFKTQFSRNTKIRQGIAKELAQKMLDILKTANAKGISDMTPDEFKITFMKDGRDRTNAYEERMRKEFIKINNGQEKEALENLPNAMKAAAFLTKAKIDPKKLLDEQKWIKITIDAITPIACDIFNTEASIASRAVGGPGIDVENSPTARDAIDEAMSLMSRSYNKTIVEQLTIKLTEGIEEGLSPTQLGDRIRDIYIWQDKAGADRVALTESRRIYSFSQKMGWHDAGVKEVQWIISPLDNVCEFCRAQEGKIFGSDANLFNQGDIIEGEDGGTMEANYSDIGNPPLHPNCRCNLKPVPNIGKTQKENQIESDEIIDGVIKELENRNE